MTVSSEVWSVIIIVTTLFRIHFWIWKFLSSWIQWIVLNRLSEMLLISFGGHPLLDLTVPTTTTLSSLAPINIREKVKTNHPHHILLCIPIGEWSNDPECILNELLPFLVFISNSYSRKYFIEKNYFCTTNFLELVAFLHRLILCPIFCPYLPLNFFAVLSTDTANPGHMQRGCTILLTLSIRSTYFAYHLASRGKTSSALVASPFTVSPSGSPLMHFSWSTWERCMFSHITLNLENDTWEHGL